MPEYIEREAAIEAISELGRNTWTLSDWYEHYIKALINAEAAVKAIRASDVAPVKRGKWIPHIEEDYIGEGQYGYIELLKCSECGTLVPNKRNFCHHCGAKMRCDDE